MTKPLYDVIIIGGGPAGMSAALILARSRRRVLIFDTGTQRNRFSDAMHGYLSRDGISPKDFLKICCDELENYGVGFHRKKVIKAEKTENEFLVEDENNHTYRSRRLLLATGITDMLPGIEGLEQFYGKSVHHCPYCDGWENRDKRIVIYSHKKGGMHLALAMKTWSPHITLLTDGMRTALTRKEIERLNSHGIPVIKTHLAKLEGKGTQLERVIFRNGDTLECDAMFFSTGYLQQCGLGEDLSCKHTIHHELVVNKLQQSSIPGVYVSGDAAHEMKLVIIAAGEGAKAGVAINIDLTREDLHAVENA